MLGANHLTLGEGIAILGKKVSQINEIIYMIDLPLGDLVENINQNLIDFIVNCLFCCFNVNIV